MAEEQWEALGRRLRGIEVSLQVRVRPLQTCKASVRHSSVRLG